jgi:hypothetical protein
LGNSSSTLGHRMTGTTPLSRSKRGDNPPPAKNKSRNCRERERWMGEPDDDLALLKAGLATLKDKVVLSRHVAVAASSADPSTPDTTLMHVRLQENLPNVHNLSEYLWNRAAYYALSRKRRQEFRDQVSADPEADLEIAALIVRATRDAFVEFREANPNRASEVGELLAYCIAIEQLDAAQLAAKMSLKTNSNMPVHGWDGIHATVEDGFLVIYFLESKLSQSANAGAADFAVSVAKFFKDKKQYRREYAIVRDLGSFDSLDPATRDVALRYFDVLNSADVVQKKERYVGVVLYSDDKAFKSIPPVAKGQGPGFHEKALGESLAKHLSHHQDAALKHLEKEGADPGKCRLYFVAVPDTAEVRKLFYDAMGYVPKDALS